LLEGSALLTRFGLAWRRAIVAEVDGFSSERHELVHVVLEFFEQDIDLLLAFFGGPAWDFHGAEFCPIC
jgi:hypothetical protein